MKKRLGSQSGQTLVELAFIIVLLLVVIFGIVEFSIIMYNKAVLTRISREAAREGILFRVDVNNNFAYSPLTESQIEAFVENNLPATGRPIGFGSAFVVANAVIPRWSLDGVNFTLTAPPATHDDREHLRVVVEYDYDFLVLSRLGASGAWTMKLASSTIMKME